MKIIDTKPSNLVIDTKPSNGLIFNIKSNNNLVDNETEIYLETRTIRKGEPMGLLLTLTYPEELTFIATRL